MFGINIVGPACSREGRAGEGRAGQPAADPRDERIHPAATCSGALVHAESWIGGTTKDATGATPYATTDLLPSDSSLG